MSVVVHNGVPLLESVAFAPFELCRRHAALALRRCRLLSGLYELGVQVADALSGCRVGAIKDASTAAIRRRWAVRDAQSAASLLLLDLVPRSMLDRPGNSSGQEQMVRPCPAATSVVPDVLRKSGLARCRVGFSRLSA